MPAKAPGVGTFTEIDRFEGGFGWIAHPEETMERASHALTTDEGVYLVDPVDAVGLDDRVEELGEVTGVVVTNVFHRRDAATIARRHDAPVLLPTWMTGLSAEDVDAPIERVDGIGDYEFLTVADSWLWEEAALWDGETLYVPDVLGTADYFLAPDERLGVIYLLRLTPPRDQFSGITPERILCGHGAGIHDDASEALDTALADARTKALGCWRANLGEQLRSLYASMTTEP